MVRPFAPARFAVGRDFYAGLIEMRLAYSGEYVRHLPTGGIPQWVVANYQYIPVEASISGDYLANGTNPRLWGYIDHFEIKPELYRDGDSVRPAKGSQFEIRGLIYNVKKVEVNHVGYCIIELTLADKCQAPRDEFEIEVADLVCLPEPECP